MPSHEGKDHALKRGFFPLGRRGGLAGPLYDKTVSRPLSENACHTRSISLHFEPQCRSPLEVFPSVIRDLPGSKDGHCGSMGTGPSCYIVRSTPDARPRKRCPCREKEKVPVLKIFWANFAPT